MSYIGKTIKIIDMEGEPRYAGKVGKVTSEGRDPWGDKFLRGTWGGCSLYLGVDSFEVIDSEESID